jgi:hypothetical protein
MPYETVKGYNRKVTKVNQHVKGYSRHSHKYLVGDERSDHKFWNGKCWVKKLNKPKAKGSF